MKALLLFTVLALTACEQPTDPDPPAPTEQPADDASPPAEPTEPTEPQLPTPAVGELIIVDAFGVVELSFGPYDNARSYNIKHRSLTYHVDYLDAEELERAPFRLLAGGAP